MVQLVEPLLSLVVGSLECNDTERIDIANLIDVDGTVDTAAQGGVRADDVGYLKTGDVECLGRRVERHAVVTASLADAGEWGVMVARHH